MAVLRVPPENEFVRELDSNSKPRINERIVPLGEVTLAFDSGWVRKNLLDSRRRLHSRFQTQARTSLVLAGNGPSLNNTQWNELDNQDLMVSNYAHLSPELISRATYWCVVNPYVAAQSSEMFEGHPETTKFIPYWLAAWLKPDQNTFLLPGTGDPAFSSDITNRVSVRSTVSYFGLQVAAALGYRRVALIGFDHRYDQLETAIEGELLEAGEKDLNHFDASYFSGKLWQAADTLRMEHVYALARIAYEDQGREIVNCSEPTNLAVFPTQSLSAFVSTKDRSSSRAHGSDVPQKLDSFFRWLFSEGRWAGYLALFIAAAVTAAFALTKSEMAVTPGALLGITAAVAYITSQYWADHRRQIRREHQFRLLSILRATDASKKSSKPTNSKSS